MLARTPAPDPRLPQVLVSSKCGPGHSGKVMGANAGGAFDYIVLQDSGTLRGLATKREKPGWVPGHKALPPPGGNPQPCGPGGTGRGCVPGLQGPAWMGTLLVSGGHSRRHTCPPTHGISTEVHRHRNSTAPQEQLGRGTWRSTGSSPPRVSQSHTTDSASLGSAPLAAAGPQPEAPRVLRNLPGTGREGQALMVVSPVPTGPSLGLRASCKGPHKIHFYRQGRKHAGLKWPRQVND
ncbi:uncharacterized protein [Symphalangus syndactylus]|uniref:uncharacterized protein n=1 Tax=Symphalangus syndactylus TaxID=9590 RepID=UPI003007AE27